MHPPVWQSVASSRFRLKSPHIQQEIKSSGPLYLSSIFSYKLVVDNIYKSGCEGVVSVRRIAPPCTVTNGKVVLYKEQSNDMAAPSQLAFQFPHTRGEWDWVNCSIFDPSRNKYCFHFTLVYSKAPSLAHTCVIVQRHTSESALICWTMYKKIDNFNLELAAPLICS